MLCLDRSVLARSFISIYLQKIDVTMSFANNARSITWLEHKTASCSSYTLNPQAKNGPLLGDFSQMVCLM